MQGLGLAVSRCGFLRSFHELHRTPPVFGVLHNWDYCDDMRIARLIPTTPRPSPSPLWTAAPGTPSIAATVGRMLFLSKAQDNLEMLLWEPITGAQQRVPVPVTFKSDHFRTAVNLSCSA
ncbi:hypothetical protein ZWY2020_018934 [Hordeum vulgare]|nr:hypothetical protein ZWY2020_018934 [Hordeum vulgare]